MGNNADIGTFLAAAAGLTIIMLIVFAALWILKSIGLSRMAKNKGIENEWLAWLPVADLYIMGAIVDEMKLFGMEIKNLGLWYPVLCLLGGLLGGIPLIGIILFIGLFIFQIAFMYKFFSIYTPQATLYTVLCIFLAFLWPIFIFSLRNNPVLGEEKITPVPENISNEEPVLADDLHAGVTAAEIQEEQTDLQAETNIEPE